MLKISEKYWFAELRLPEAEEDAAVAAAAATPAVWRRPPNLLALPGGWPPLPWGWQAGLRGSLQHDAFDRSTRPGDGR